MGKYMRKSKTTGGDVADLTLGVRTRAKTLALQRHSPPYLLRSCRRPKDSPGANHTLSRANHRVERPAPRPRRPVRVEGDGLEKEEGLGLEGSFGENCLEIDSRERSTRESTPSNLLRDPESIQTPGSTTRPTSSTDAERRSQTQRGIPSTRMLDGFFAKSEEEQRQSFIQKYNFDPLDEKPLPGNFEWEKVDP